jgi:uncharacterized protein DUF6799
MKKLLGVLAFATINLTLFAQEPGQKKDSVLPYYIMMKHGKLTEVSHGRKNFVTRDITLVNETTIHPNGTINVSSGRTRHLHEGQYMTFDGRIRWLKNMPSVGVLRL